MENSLLQVMIDYGSLGIMCAFLFWQHIQNQKRNDALSVRFQDQLDNIRASSKEDEEKIRARFQIVVEKYDSERIAFFEERSSMRSELADKIDNIQSQLDQMNVSGDEVLQLLRSAEQERRLLQLSRTKE
jgi:hypothetical protein|tara:strand:+ start:256 stop:645 length:390 start_codon:yes stop_codon:yes gene_type:complete